MSNRLRKAVGHVDGRISSVITNENADDFASASNGVVGRSTGENVVDLRLQLVSFRYVSPTSRSDSSAAFSRQFSRSTERKWQSERLFSLHSVRRRYFVSPLEFSLQNRSQLRSHAHQLRLGRLHSRRMFASVLQCRPDDRLFQSNFGADSRRHAHETD